jgi:phage shock protein E
MRVIVLLIAASVLSAFLTPVAYAQTELIKQLPIDMGGFLLMAQEAAQHRDSRRIDEVAFLNMSTEPGTVVLDARSKEKFDLLHVKGAINLSFPDITVASLRQQIPDTATRILIYCNNNFFDAEDAFPSKLPSASLNLYTYVALYSYGYRNVYELSIYVDPKLSKLPFVANLPDK